MEQQEQRKPMDVTQLKCPSCGNNEKFKVSARVEADLTPRPAEGQPTVVPGDYQIDMLDRIACPVCGWVGTPARIAGIPLAQEIGAVMARACTEGLQIHQGTLETVLVVPIYNMPPDQVVQQRLPLFVVETSQPNHQRPEVTFTIFRRGFSALQGVMSSLFKNSVDTAMQVAAKSAASAGSDSTAGQSPKQEETSEQSQSEEPSGEAADADQ